MVSYFATFLIQTYGLSVEATAGPLAVAAVGQVIGSYSAGYVAEKRYGIALIEAACAIGRLFGLLFLSIPVEYWVALVAATLRTGLLGVPSPTLMAPRN